MNEGPIAAGPSGRASWTAKLMKREPKIRVRLRRGLMLRYCFASFVVREARPEGPAAIFPNARTLPRHIFGYYLKVRAKPNRNSPICGV